MDQSFLDPLTSSDGKPYAEKRYKEIWKECWFISDNLHTDINSVLDFAASDRLLLISLITDKQKAERKALEAATAKNKQK